ncbi:cysteine dioxygenase [Thalassobacillus pellis]|uniref:cysteine dioxygenase n=1 Tax=Thalassobacillus pellis TaxID=748008 RepID=UPI001961BF58|nr:cysteine dioxygenase family protein [Thalassobacillus pellis]MBM7553470.1 cysteine dioxygenase [Thalassobacillus pellis]
MKLTRRAKEVLGKLESFESEDLKTALDKLAISREELEEHLHPPEDKPYQRKALYKDENTELLVMNWADIECAPHDHGDSIGWIQVVNGTTKQTVYKVKGNRLPKVLFHEYKEKGDVFFSPRKGVHKMGRKGGDPLITVHLYSPPIQGMKVYDLDACAACIVSEECGAWWPEDQSEKISEIKLRAFKKAKKKKQSSVKK